MNIVKYLKSVRRSYKKYETFTFWEHWFGGHVNILNMTIYGENSMHWACNIHTKKYGYICFRLPVRCFGRWWKLYLYTSPNATPWASTFQLGGEASYRMKAIIRRYRFGHNFKVDENYDRLRKINDL